MENIYKEIEKRGIKMYPYQKERYDHTKEQHILPSEVITNMSDEDFKNYIKALYNIHNENACGYDGWTTAHKIFEKLGFVKKEVNRGHRTFVSYVYEEKVEEKPKSKEPLEIIKGLNITFNKE